MKAFISDAMKLLSTKSLSINKKMILNKPFSTYICEKIWIVLIFRNDNDDYFKCFSKMSSFPTYHTIDS